MPKRRANNEIQLARGRLLGILQDLAELDEENDDSDKGNLPLRGRPPKRIKQGKVDGLTSVHESFVMKLFDRSLDLARFQESTALYSVCRAWNLNKPRADITETDMEDQIEEPQKREKMPELRDNILKNDIGIILSMPAPQENLEGIEKKEKISIDDIAINNSTLSNEELLKDHKTQWKKTKESWMGKIKKRHDRYALSFQLLNAIKEI